MKHIVLTILVCLDVVAFGVLYQRTTQIVIKSMLEGLWQISVSTGSTVRRDLILTFIGHSRASVESEVIQ
jgi:hypothetical protein